MRLLDALYIPAAAVLAPWWAFKKREGWNERFGKIEPLPPPRRGPRVLLHAVSVGEVSALRELVPLLAHDHDVVVSATTDTGIQRARELYASKAHVVRYPLDLSWCVSRFLDAVRPECVALVELELWPNFVRECQRRSIPVCVVNGRLSERSFKGYRRIRRAIRPTFARLACAAVQDDDYAARFRAMGVAPDKCVVTGSMKWDSARIEDAVQGADQLAAALGIDPSRPLIVAGSTGPIPPTTLATSRGPTTITNEEELLHLTCPPGVQLLCAPRKPERFEEAAPALPGCVRRSKPGSGEPASGRFLLDTIGELRAAYSLATLVVVGRSFGGLFGSDPIEPIALGKPVVIGPCVADFSQIVRDFETAGGLARADTASLAAVLSRLVSDGPARSALAEAGREVIRKRQGASARHADLVKSLLAAGGRDLSGRDLSGVGQSGVGQSGVERLPNGEVKSSIGV
jgi:3-deoxy-D-manno-octulosonic-acid transferase